MTKSDIQELLAEYENKTDKLSLIILCLARREFKRLSNVGKKSQYSDDPKEQNRQRQKRFRERKQVEELQFRQSRELSQALASDRADKRYNEPKRKKKN